MPQNDHNSWDQARYYVFEELKRHDKMLDDHEDRIQATENDISVIKATAAWWAACLVFVLLWLLR
jgi:hypothetical protein